MLRISGQELVQAIRCGVTVIAKTGIAADSLATAISVLGPEKGIAFIETIPNAAAYVVFAEGDKVEKVHSNRFPNFSGEGNAPVR